MTKTCLWVLANNSQCGVPTTYKLVEDGGEPGAAKVRKYEPFCDVHKKRVEESELYS